MASPAAAADDQRHHYAGGVAEVGVAWAAVRRRALRQRHCRPNPTWATISSAATAKATASSMVLGGGLGEQHGGRQAAAAAAAAAAGLVTSVGFGGLLQEMVPRLRCPRRQGLSSLALHEPPLPMLPPPPRCALALEALAWGAGRRLPRSFSLVCGHLRCLVEPQLKPWPCATRRGRRSGRPCSRWSRLRRPGCWTCAARRPGRMPRPCLANRSEFGAGHCAEWELGAVRRVAALRHWHVADGA